MNNYKDDNEYNNKLNKEDENKNLKDDKYNEENFLDESKINLEDIALEEKIEEEKLSFFEEKQTENKHFFKKALIFLVVFLLGGASFFATQVFYFFNKTPLSSRVVVTQEDKNTEELTINAVSKAKDAVVSVVNYQKNPERNFLSSIQDNNISEFKVASNGSGVIYKKDGNSTYIVTNEHVINKAEKIDVVLSNGTVLNAQLVGEDIWTDLAVLKISSENINVVMDFADSDKIAVGQTALAIGSPLGVSLSNTVTKGIISAVERQIPIDIDKDGVFDWYQTVLQTDAAINPGNSGGALINNAGELIGINELKIINTTQSTPAEGIGFVIPSNEVRIITEQLEKFGKVSRSALGVHLVSISSLNSDILKETLNFYGNKGVVVKKVEEGKPSFKSGLKEYDIITKINELEIQQVADLRKYLFEKTKIGDKVRITYIRKGKEYFTEIILGKLE